MPTAIVARVTMQSEQQVTRDTYDCCAAAFARRFDESDFGAALRKFTALLPEGGRVLDLGCGSGRDLKWLSQRGFESVGIDWSRAMLNEARQRTDALLTLGDLRALPFADATFDGVWSNASMVHLGPAELHRALVEVERVLRPGGVFFASIASGAGEEWRETWNGKRRWFRYYGATDVASAINQAGLSVAGIATEPGVTHGTWVNVWSVKL